MNRPAADFEAGVDAVLDALTQRLTEAARIILGEERTAQVVAEGDPLAARLLPQLVETVRGTDDPSTRWLLLTAVRGRFPNGEEFMSFTRQLDLIAAEVTETELLRLAVLGGGRPDLPLRIVSDAPVVDVNFSARHDLHTGIHRVVRETVPRWDQAHDLVPVAWIDEGTAYRSLAPRELARVLSFHEDVVIDLEEEAAYRPELIVPWRTMIILPDVPNAASAPALTALSRWSGSRVSLIGYDLIPITSADQRPAPEATSAANFLTAVKHADRVAGISASATTEFRGFAHSLTAQGLTPPEVRKVLLPEDAPPSPNEAPRPAPTRPVILLTGTREPHKNHRAVLHAAERLWNEGLDFEIRMVGGKGWSDAVLRPALERLHTDGRPVVELGRVSEESLWSELRAADAVVFISLHEGFGLPVAEALSVGTPVITSNFGSQAEIAENGGCLIVDPRDDDDIARAMRSFLTDPDLRARLAAEALVRPQRTWNDYAAELWEFFMAEPTEGRQ